MGPTYDLPTTMSKFLLLGLSLDQVVEKVTTAPAQAIGKKGNLGTLKPGRVADAVVFDRRRGQFTFEDSYGEKRVGRERLVPRAVVRGGVVYPGVTWSEVGWVPPPGPLYPPRDLSGQGPLEM
jgi:dihydroorotase